jgi:hypothetical protein
MELDELREGVNQSLSKDQNLEPTRGPIGRKIEQTRESATQQRRETALRMGSLAMAGHHAAADLEEHFPQAARYINDAAAGFEHVSNFLHDPNLDEVATFIGNLGRKQPAAVAAGVLLLVAGLAWLLKTSHETSEGAMTNDRERGAYGVH